MSASGGYGTVEQPDSSLLFDDDIREIELDYSRAEASSFCSNYIRTSKYTWYSFLPLTLMEQFRRAANAYFLFVSILMAIGEYTTLFDTPSTPWSTLLTLTSVVFVSMVRSGLEDNKRGEADKQINNKLSRRLLRSDESGNILAFPNYENPSEGIRPSIVEEISGRVIMEEVRWKNIRVGDILYLRSGDQIPADVILVSSSEIEGNAYVETSNIDGEINLKLKNSVATKENSVGSVWNKPLDLCNAKFNLFCEKPHTDITSFQGVMTHNGRDISVDSSSFLLRGSTIRNVKWALGVVVYTGVETKSAMNSRDIPFKVSSLESRMNQIIKYIIVVQVCISIGSLLAYLVYKYSTLSTLGYLCYNAQGQPYFNKIYAASCAQVEDGYSDISNAISFFILFCGMLPIAMYVLIEMCSFFQAFFLENDKHMYDESTDMPAIVRSSNLNGDLGMVDYIFSDKTGTLTENIMIFKRCSVEGRIYGMELSDNASFKQPFHVADSKQALEMDILSDRVRASHKAGTTFDNKESLFVLMMAVCHTIVKNEGGDLQSESPDEEALCNSARNLGFEFIGREGGSITVSDSSGTEHTFSLVATIPFDSSRKRMSVVLKHPNGKIFIYCKGADDVIFDRLETNSDQQEQEGRNNLSSHLTLFASEGLRTLVLSRRELSVEEYSLFSDRWMKARASLTNRKELVAQAAALIENDLQVMGATAIEDKLQYGVPETLEDLNEAGIKVWVLTGDKAETALNIGCSSHLLRTEMVLIKLVECVELSSLAHIRSRLIAFNKALLNLAGKKSAESQVVSGLSRPVRDTIRIEGAFFTDNDFDEEHGHGISSSDLSLSDVEDHTLLDTVGQDRIDEEEEGLISGRSVMSALEGNPLIEKFPAAPELIDITTDHLAMIVDGTVLLKIFSDSECKRQFLLLAKVCRSVIGCRLSPDLKRSVVRLVKNDTDLETGLKPVTLAIGDGANDVPMLQEAKVGVGISGREGRQAVNNSDYAIGQFRFLRRLLFVHGRTNYVKSCKVILFSLYKSFVMVMILVYYCWFSAFTPQQLFDGMLLSSYNITLTLPVFAFGTFDIDIKPETLLKYKVFYMTGRLKLGMCRERLLANLLEGLIDSILLFLIPYFCYNHDLWGSSARNFGFDSFGPTLYLSFWFVMVLRTIRLTCTWTYITHACFWFSFFLFALFLNTYSYMISLSYDFYGTNVAVFGSNIALSVVIASVSACYFVIVLVGQLRYEYKPSLVDVAQDVDKTRMKYDEFQKEQENENEALLRSAGADNQTSSRKHFVLDWEGIKSIFSRTKPDSNLSSITGVPGVSDRSETLAAGAGYNFAHAAEDGRSSAISSSLMFPRNESQDRAGVDTYEGQNDSLGLFHGQGTVTYTDGGTYSGNFVRGSRDGSGQMVYPNGDTYQGSWINDQRQGKGILRDKSGRKIFKGQWAEDEQTSKLLS